MTPHELISPVALLSVTLGVTGAACAVAAILRRRTACRLEALARQWQMRYSPEDPFGLAAQVAARFPIPGAADILVRDLIYVQEADQFRYFFTVEYTMGVIRRRRRRVIVGTMAESRQKTGWEQYSSLELGPGEESVVRQYEALREQVGGVGRDRAVG